MKQNKVLELSKTFSVKIMNLCKTFPKHIFAIMNQILRSATSIGANLHESVYAQSKLDFISKLKIALKECYETEYWLELLKQGEYISEDNFKDLKNDCGQIKRILIKSCNTMQSEN